MVAVQYLPACHRKPYEAYEPLWPKATTRNYSNDGRLFKKSQSSPCDMANFEPSILLAQLKCFTYSQNKEEPEVNFVLSCTGSVPLTYWWDSQGANWCRIWPVLYGPSSQHFLDVIHLRQTSRDFQSSGSQLASAASKSLSSLLLQKTWLLVT